MADHRNLFLKIVTRPPAVTPPVCSECKGEVLWDEDAPLCVNCTAFEPAAGAPMGDRAEEPELTSSA